MVDEDFQGRIREVSWGTLQDDSNRFANVLRSHGVEPGDRVAMLLPPTPETAAAFFGVWKAGAILLSMSVLYGDEGIRHRSTTCGRRCCSPTPRTPAGSSATWWSIYWCSTTGSWGTVRPRSSRSTPRRRTRPSSTTPRASTGLAKGILHAHRYILAHEEFISLATSLRDGGVHGMGEWAWAAGSAR